MAIAPRVTLKGAHEPDLVLIGDMLPRLCGASLEDAVRIASTLSARQRAHLAVFCYGRVHLRALAVAIAKTCPLPALLSAAPSDACGRAIHEATRACAEAVKPPFRRPVTLATASSVRMFAPVGEQPDDDIAFTAPDLAANDRTEQDVVSAGPALV